MEETEKSFNAVFELMCKELKERHIRWVNENWALRGMELAKRQIKNEGDISVDYAMELLQRGYNRLFAANERSCKEMYAYESFIRGFMREVKSTTGIVLDANKITEAMNAMYTPFQLPAFPI